MMDPKASRVVGAANCRFEDYCALPSGDRPNGMFVGSGGGMSIQEALLELEVCDPKANIRAKRRGS